MSVTRKSLSKKTRFEVFKRDSFSCAYCGKTPPSVTLEVDHIIPVSKGGLDVIDNLVTSCFDCNRGKSDTELTSLPETTNIKLELITEKEDQYKAYQKMLASIEKRIRKEIEMIDDIFIRYFPNRELTDGFKNTSVRNFIKKLGYNEVALSMEQSCSKMPHYDAPKYFCGICWNKIKNPNGKAF